MLSSLKSISDTSYCYPCRRGQVCIEPRTSARNMTLPAAAARAPAAISCRSIDGTRGRQLSCRSTTAARAQVAASGRCRSTGQTDGRTPDRYIHSAPHEPTAREVPIRHFLLKYYKNIRRLSRISFKYLQDKTQNIYALQISVKTVLFFYNIVSQSMISLKF